MTLNLKFERDTVIKDHTSTFRGKSVKADMNSYIPLERAAIL